MKIDQSIIDSNIQNAKQWMTTHPKGGQEIQECALGLHNTDYNRDGKTTAQELGQSWQSTLDYLFGNIPEYSEKISYLNSEIQSIFEQYAGEDGIFDVFEYEAAIQSEEYGSLVDEYWALRDELGIGRTQENTSTAATQETSEDGTDSLFDYYNKKKGEYIDEIISYSSEVLDEYVGANGVIVNEALPLWTATSELVNESIQAIVDCMFKDVVAILGDDTSSDAMKHANLSRVLENMKSIKDRTKQELDKYRSENTGIPPAEGKESSISMYA